MTTTPGRPIRVFQVATGNVGSEMIKRIGRHPDLELVGVHCYTPDKIGRDVGELAGVEPVGVLATGTVEEIVAARPDVLTFHGVFPDEDLYLAVLEAGINIVTTADWITGHHRTANHPHPSGRPWAEIIDEAAKKGGVTFYGTGMNPGLNQILGIVVSADVAEIENVTTIESVDVSCHHSADTWREVGYGLPVDDPALPGMLRRYTEVFADSVWMMADAFDLEGLLADAGHLAADSGVAIDVHAAAFEVPEPLHAVGAALNADPLQFLLGGGDDHALLATFEDVASVPAGWAVIGEVAAGAGVTVDGAAYDGPTGWTHF